MALEYKVNVLATLKAAGYNTNRLRTEKLLPESTIQKVRSGLPINWSSIEKICSLLHCQPGDILQYTEDADSN